MAAFNEIQNGRVNRFFQLWAGIKGRAPTGTLGSEVQPQITLFSGVEDRVLQFWSRFGMSKDLGPAAGQQLNWQLRNPNGSGTIGIVEQVFLSATTAQGYHIDISHGPGTGSLTTVQAGTRLDGRNPTTQSLETSFQSTSLVESTQIASVILLNGNFSLISNENQEIPLAPGDSILVVGTGLNVPGQVGFIWRERALAAEELRGSVTAGGGIV